MSEIEFADVEQEACAICGEHAISHSVETQQFAYQAGEKAVLLTAQVPVISCAACEEVYTGEGAEEAQHEAVCRYLGRLTPAEIRELRLRHNLSQAKLAQQTGIGIASIKRWESGSLIQNESLDRRLRSLDEAVAKAPVKIEGRFRTQMTPDIIAAARRFCLRPALAYA